MRSCSPLYIKTIPVSYRGITPPFTVVPIQDQILLLLILPLLPLMKEKVCQNYFLDMLSITAQKAKSSRPN